MTIKEWAAAYRADNEAEREELKVRLPQEKIEDSVQSYFSLCKLTVALSGTPDEPKEFHEKRAREYSTLLERWTLLAQRLKRA